MENLTTLIADFLPEAQQIREHFLPLFLYAVVCASICGWLRHKVKVSVPYSRKSFHLLIFSAAGFLHARFGLPTVSLFGGIVFLIVLAAVYIGPSLWFYKALARPTDQPHANKFIILPLIATAAGGVLSNMLFPSTAFIGYFVGGWGDAVGEPVGTRWGKNRYSVPTLFGVPASRSLEGSLAVAVVSALICYIVSMFGGVTYNVPIWLAAIICGMLAAGVEAFSSHGLDNLTIQLSASCILFYLS